MARLLVVVPFLVLAFDVFAIVDVMLIDGRRFRALNRPLWVLLILVLPVIGALLWFLVGRARRDGESERRRTVAPDDDPAFLRNLRRDEEQDERIRRLEQELADLDDDPPAER